MIRLKGGLELEFNFIPGQIVGSTTGEVLLTVPVDSTDSAVVNFTESMFTLTTKPEVLNSLPVSDGLIVDPPDARFGRMGTFARDITGGFAGPGPYGLYNATNSKPFIVMYFDRPTSLTGNITTATESVNINIVADNAGFHLIDIDLAAGILQEINLIDDPYFVLGKTIVPAVASMSASNETNFNVNSDSHGQSVLCLALNCK